MTRALFDVRTLLLIASIGTNARAQTQPSEPLVIDIPSNVTQCGATNVTWSGGVPPYTILFNSLDPNMPASGNLAAGTFNTSLLWTVAEPAGQGLFLSVFDFGVSTATSQRFVVQPSDGTSCLPSSE
ncbi:hypothetical protein MSAN_00447600 [Mycena sanguinolenta]|uniref:Secreted protein n=1 Tax=Mycena sanguinolenta TaxID=230812 RepID=A0A8H6ZHC0_9AGAR|nr:hypothetical protein MSAN_00447600 [Mycena sanguinolenta]